MPLADLYRPAIHDDRRAVVPHRRHRTARHILVTPGQGYVPVIVLGLDIILKKGTRVSTLVRSRQVSFLIVALV